MQNIVISKFGGTSLADVEAMTRCADYLAEAERPRVVVVSALAGVTDRLQRIARRARAGGPEALTDDVAALISRHRALAEHWDWPEPQQARLERAFTFLEKWTKGLALLDGGSPDAVDRLLSAGEWLSALIFTQALREVGVAAVFCDVRDVLRTDHHFGAANPNIAATAELVRRIWSPVLEREHVIVTQGFVGATDSGQTTTLGRGGSDFSAALLAEAFQAHAVEIWTDVPGIASADPNLLSTAKILPEISFAEAAELAVFGAKILHPKTLWPAIRKGIPVFVGHSKTFASEGTHIVPNLPPSVQGPRAVAIRRDQRLVTLTSLRMLHAAGYLSRIFEILSRYDISVDMVTTSEISVALTLDNPADFSAAVQSELGEIATVQVESDLALLAVVGNGLGRQTGVTERLCAELAGIAIRMICQGASDHSLGLLVANADADEALRRLHDACLRAQGGGA